MIEFNEGEWSRNSTNLNIDPGILNSNLGVCAVLKFKVKSTATGAPRSYSNQFIVYKIT